MRTPGTLPRFLGARALAALAGLALASACLGLLGMGSILWLAIGHGAMLTGGLVTGGWLLARLGEPMARFLPALVVGIALRMALVLAVTGGVTLGVLAAVYQNRSWDYLSVTVATIGVSVPNFVLAVFLIVLFSLILPIFPTGGWNSPIDWVLPTVTLALAPLGIIARFTRSSMIEVIRSDYIVTARAKGLAERPVILKHVLKNAFIPVVTLLGPMFAAVGTGSFFVESIFRVPGMGRFFVLSMTGRDYPMIMAVVLTYGAFLAIMNLVVDLLYGVLDPRIRY